MVLIQILQSSFLDCCIPALIELVGVDHCLIVFVGVDHHMVSISSFAEPFFQYPLSNWIGVHTTDLV